MNATLGQPQPQGTLQEAAERLMTPPSEATIEEETKGEAVESEETTEDSSAREDISLSSEVPQEAEAEEPTTVEETQVEVVEAVESEPADDVSELNEWLGEAKDRYDDLVIPTKINGEEGQVRLSELVKNYQIGESVEQRAEEMKARKAEFDEANRQKEQQMAERLQYAEQLSQNAEQFFTKQFEGIDWEDLRETDPAEYSARRQEQADVQQGLERFRYHVAAQQQQLMNEQFQQIVQNETSKLAEAIPEWTDAETAKKEKAELRDYLLSYGLQPHEIDGVRDANGNVVSIGVVDHRQISMARKAMLYDKGQQKVAATKKRVRNVPKMARPGKAESVESVTKAKSKARREKLRKTGDIKDAASLIFDSMNG